MKKAFFCIMLVILLLNGTILYAQDTSREGLSEEEIRYIERTKILRVSIMKDWMPIASKDGITGSYSGLTVDILRRLEEETGIEISYVEAGSYSKAVEMVERGQVDLTAVFVGYSTSEEVPSLQTTDTYLSSQMMMLYNKNTKLGQLEQYDMAEVRGYPVFTDNPIVSHMTFDTLDECIAAVRANHADMTFCDIFTGMAYLHKYENRDIVSFPIEEEMQLRFGIAKSESQALAKLLNRTIAGMNRKNINDSLIYNWRSATDSFGDFVYYYLFEIICVVVTVTFLILMFYITYIRVKNRQSIASHGYIQSYCMLADTLGEAGLNYNYLEDRMTVFGKNADKLAMPSEIENFSAYLENEKKEISLTKTEFSEMLKDGMTGKCFDIALECRLREGEWHHFRLIFSVIATDESYQRPICMIGCLTDAEKDYKEKKELRHLGMYDKLTGLLNRAGADIEFKKYLSTAEDVANDVLLIVDVDYFKTFNDVSGHECGDDVLSTIGYQLKCFFRKEDIICRWGGDEFMLYLIGAASHIEEIEGRCAKLQEVLREYKFEGANFPVTLSIGGTIVGEKSLREAFQAADKSLYHVKENGRDAVCILSE